MVLFFGSKIVYNVLLLLSTQEAKIEEWIDDIFGWLQKVVLLENK